MIFILVHADLMLVYRVDLHNYAGLPAQEAGPLATF